MATISEMATTYNCPNYVGELFSASPEDTPLLSAIGGLTGGESVGSTVFTWEGYDLRDADATRQRTEGADATALEARARFSASNVLEIHQEAVAVSYTKLGATRQVGSGTGATQVTTGTMPADELAWQVEQKLKEIARDIEKSFLTGVFAQPTTNATPRKTRGLISAITTNTATSTHKASQLTEDEVLDLMQKVWSAGGIQESETRTIIVNATLKRALSRIFIKDANFRQSDRTVGGVNLQTIETDFGACNIMLNRYMPLDKLVVASLEQLKPAFLEVPGKGHVFAEPLAKTGSADKVQLYCETGLIYGNEKAHGVLTVAQG
nr:MAG TPA: Major capsid protein [Caudoviricetes sp.]DAT99670.1 MAG TPA: Major capsid protein [Caudoviricetes sp.]